MQHHSPFPAPGTDLGALTLEVTAPANDRYWRGAGIDHPAREAQLLYPPMGVNFTILLVQRTISAGLLHTWGRLWCHTAVAAPQAVSIAGRVTDRWVRRARDYFTVASEVRDAGGSLLWSIESDFAAARRRDDAEDGRGPDHQLSVEVDGEVRTRSLTLTSEALRTYSRAGNFHSDDAAANEMGLPGKVAMGMQTLGPAYGLLLDAWGDDLLRCGEIECRFVDMVSEGETAEARVAIADRSADVEVVNTETDRVTGVARVLLTAA